MNAIGPIQARRDILCGNAQAEAEDGFWALQDALLALASYNPDTAPLAQMFRHQQAGTLLKKVAAAILSGADLGTLCAVAARTAEGFPE